MQEVKKVITEVGTNEWQVVVFFLGDQTFAINVDKTREILRWPGCRTISCATSALRRTTGAGAYWTICCPPVPEESGPDRTGFGPVQSGLAFACRRSIMGHPAPVPLARQTAGDLMPDPRAPRLCVLIDADNVSPRLAPALIVLEQDEIATEVPEDVAVDVRRGTTARPATTAGPRSRVSVDAWSPMTHLRLPQPRFQEVEPLRAGGARCGVGDRWRVSPRDTR